MKNSVHFRYHFFAVGQGLFTCGMLYRDNERYPRFVWVYDCGTTSSPQLIKEAIDELAGMIGQSQRVDLLVLSHFDHDHISGVCKLIGGFHIGTLLLPYMRREHLLLAAFGEKVDPTDPLIDFFVNPVDYLGRIGGLGIGRIAFVQPSGGEGPPPSTGQTTDSPLPGDGPVEVVISEDRNFPISAREWLSQRRNNTGRGLIPFFLRRNSAVTVQGLWEFVPYNDDIDFELPPEFIAQVEYFKKTLLSSDVESERVTALRALKETYVHTFGDSSEERNAISLFFYSGPIYGSWHHTELLGFSHYPYHFFPRLHRCWHWANISHGDRARCSLLYTGDGYLDSPDKLNRLLEYMRSDRMERVGTFQVMHHGSDSNWFKGVAAKIAPLFSVFSSDPAHKKFGHPHGSVLRDFWPYSPVQVDKVSDFTVHGLVKN